MGRRLCSGLQPLASAKGAVRACQLAGWLLLDAAFDMAPMRHRRDGGTARQREAGGAQQLLQHLPGSGAGEAGLLGSGQENVTMGRHAAASMISRTSTVTRPGSTRASQ